MNMLEPRFSKFLATYGNVGITENLETIGRVKSQKNQRFKLIEETGEYMGEVTRFITSDRPQEDIHRIEEFGDVFFLLLQFYYNSRNSGMLTLITGLQKVDTLLSVEPEYRAEFIHDIKSVSDEVIYKIIVEKMNKFRRKHMNKVGN